MLPVLIRPYREADQAAVLRIWEDATRLAHPFLSEGFIEDERDNLISLYLPRTQTWVAQGDGVLGFVSVFEAEVGGLFVAPGHHRRGIGRALLSRARDRSPSLTLEVFETNRSARDFYAACGFQEVGGRSHEETGMWLIELRCAAG